MILNYNQFQTIIKDEIIIIIIIIKPKPIINPQGGRVKISHHVKEMT